MKVVLLCLLSGLALAAPGRACSEDAQARGLEPAPLPEPQLAPATNPTRGLPVRASPLDPSSSTAAQAGADQPDAPEIEKQIEAQSAEIEEMREAEEKSNVLEPLRPEQDAARSTSRLGLESPLRQRLREAFGRELSPAPPDARGRIALLPEIDHDLAHLQAEYDIPIEVNEAVVAYVRFFQSEPARHHFVKWLGRSYRYLSRFRGILREEGLPEDTVFLAMIESGFANLATSRARAVGPWQFIAATGRRMGLKEDFWVDERRDPEKAAHAAARFLKELYAQTGDWKLAWAGYNAGVGKIFRAQRNGQTDFWTMARGRVLKKETKGYVPKLMAAAIIAKHPDAFGFKRDEIDPQTWTEYEEVTIDGATALAAIASAAEVDEKELLDLNPELRRACTPPGSYAIKLPKGRAEVFAGNWPSASQDARLAFAHHRVQRGDSMVAIAAAYGVPASTIVRMNGLKPGRRVRAGTELVIPLSGLARKKGIPTEVAARARIEEYRRHTAEPPDKKTRLAAARRSKSEKASGAKRAVVLVRSGDSLWGIAQKFGVGITELCRWNGIRNPHRAKLQIGRELVVYPRSANLVRADG